MHRQAYETMRTAPAKPLPRLRLRVLEALIGSEPLTAVQVHKLVSKGGPADFDAVAFYLRREAQGYRVYARADGGRIVYELAPGTATTLKHGAIR